jgi:hypothetical protein
MTRFLFPILAAAFVPASIIAAPVPADGSKGTTFPYPAKAPIVVCVNGYDKARERLSAMLKAALPEDAASITKSLDDQLSKLLEGRKLTGVRKDARAFLVVNELTGILEGHLPGSLLVPVTSYKEFRESFLTKDELKTYEKGRDGVDSVKTSATGDETTIYMVDLKEYIAATPDKGVAEAYAAKYTAGTSETMGQLAESFLKADVALFVNMDAINDQFGDQIRTFRGLIDFGLQQAQQQGALAGMTKKQLEAMKTMLKGMFQGIEDSRAIVVAAEFRPNGLLARVQARFADKTPSAKLIQSEPSHALKDLTKLPKGFNIYTETYMGETLGSLFRELSQEFVAAEDDDKGAAAIDKFQKDRLAAGPEESTAAANTNGTGVVMARYKDSAKAAKAILAAYKAIGSGGRIGGVVVKSAPKITQDAQKDHGFTFSEVQVQFDLEGTVASLQDPQKEVTLEMLKRTVGEKQTLWIGSDAKGVVTITAKDWTTAKGMLDKTMDTQNEVGSDPAFKLTRDQLPMDATAVMIGETASTLTSLFDQIKGAMTAIPGAPDFGKLKPLKAAPTYIGGSFSMKDDTVSMTLFVPTGAVAAARKMLDGVFKNVE